MPDKLWCLGTAELFDPRMLEFLGEQGFAVERVPSNNGGRLPQALGVGDYALIEHSARFQCSDPIPETNGNSGCRTALITESEPKAIFLDDGLNRLSAHILAAAPEVDFKELKATLRKMRGEELPGLEPYLDTSDVRRIEVKDSELKSAYINEVVLNAVCEGVRQRLVMQIADIIDEMVMNALFNAPVDAEGRYIHQGRGRSEHVVLQDGKEASLAYGFDDENVAISVRDPYGSLDRNVLVERLRHCYRGGEMQMDRSRGGAGLGIYTILENAHKLVVNLEAGKCTEFIALVSRKKNARRNVSKSFHLFLKDG